MAYNILLGEKNFGNKIESTGDDQDHYCISCKKKFDTNSSDVYYSQGMKNLWCKECLFNPKVSTIFPGYHEHAFYPGKIVNKKV